MFIVFEGIDGSGKTTLSNRLARTLAGSGLRVEHVREEGRYASRIAQSLRELGRDARNLALVPQAELLLLAAREAQLFEEVTRPALARADVVIADRFFYTAEVLAACGRGLDGGRVRQLVQAAAGGVQPDLVFLVDVDPHIARARRRVSKIVSKSASTAGPSRKNLAGAGLQRRLREGYLALAAEDPSRWMVLGNSDGSLDEIGEELVAWTRIAAHLGADAAIRAFAATASAKAPRPRSAATQGLGNAATRFLRWVDSRAATEPAVAAHFLGGLAGPGVDERRLALARHAPEVTAEGLAGLTDPVSWELRETLTAVAPRHVARSLRGQASRGELAARFRERLAPVVPSAVADSLTHSFDDASWRLRELLYDAVPANVVASLARCDDERAWSWRDALRGSSTPTPDIWNALCDSVEGLDGERAWKLRREAFAECPVAALASLQGVFSDAAWEWRERWAAKAPRIVMRTLQGSVDPRAWALRAALAPLCKEAIDSLSGLDVEPAWALRHSMADRWPSTVVKSLGETLASTSRGRDLLDRQLARHGDDLSLLKHVTSLSLATAATMTDTATAAS